MKVVYVGCGMNAIEGAINLDNSFSVLLGGSKFLYILCDKLKLLKPEQKTFIKVIKEKNIKYGNATKLPFKDHTIDVVYSSHTIEHLYEEDFVKFMEESERVLKPDGVFRIVIPDLSIHLQKYEATKDADAFCKSLNMKYRQRPAMMQKLSLLLFGDRKHKWMYDGKSLKKFIESHSNFKATILPAGETTIKGNTGINLRERENESAYLECIVRY